MNLRKIKEWFKSKKKPKRERLYEEEKREFEMAMGKPFINIKVEMPDDFQDLRVRFLDLEKDEQFLEEVKDLVKKRLAYERRGIKPPS